MHTHHRHQGGRLSYEDVFPPAQDTHLRFIGQIKSSIREEAHTLLTSRQANVLVGADLAYAAGRFEALQYEHLIKLFLEVQVEAITLQREAVKARNTGTGCTAPTPDATKVPDDKRGGCDKGANPGGRPNKVRNAWQRTACDKEVYSNATISSTGEVAELQGMLGDYVNSTGEYGFHKGVWAAPCTPSARGDCSRCSQNHFIDVPCNGGSPNVVMPLDKRHSKCSKNMARDMDAGKFKRLTHLFQGGTEGYPKAATRKADSALAVAAAAVVVAASTASPGKKKTKRRDMATKRSKASEKAAAAAVAAAAHATAEDGSESDNQDGNDQDGDLACDALATATRVSVAATGAHGHQQLASRQRRRGTRSVLSATATLAVISVTQTPSALTPGHGTAPCQSGVAQQEAGHADPVSVAYGSVEQCDRAPVPQQLGIERPGTQHTTQHTARLNTTARDLIRDRSGGTAPGHDDHPTMGDGCLPEGQNYHRISPLRCPEKGNPSPCGNLTHSAHNAVHPPAPGCPMGSITGDSSTKARGPTEALSATADEFKDFLSTLESSSARRA